MVYVTPIIEGLDIFSSKNSIMTYFFFLFEAVAVKVWEDDQTPINHSLQYMWILIKMVIQSNVDSFITGWGIFTYHVIIWNIRPLYRCCLWAKGERHLFTAAFLSAMIQSMQSQYDFLLLIIMYCYSRNIFMNKPSAPKHC